MKKILAAHWFIKFKIKYILPLGLFDKIYLSNSLDEAWEVRIRDVIKCPDNSMIIRHPKAGLVKNGKQIMHNGITTTMGGYYGEPIVQMLYKNKGVHEPQEEYAFDLVLKEISAGATMIELGAYWSFYSIWFNKNIKNAQNFLVEPDKVNIIFGINNFRINKVKGKFTNAFVAKAAGSLEGIPIICVDDYVKENKIDFIDILHSDIQGHEYDMLLGALHTITSQKVGYMFISTHGNKVHYDCIDFLKAHDFTIVCSADEYDTYSLDGLIVARSNHYPGLNKIDISLKTKNTNY
ncbi:FkbM family methyltransferase [Ferruginibacter sp.]|uniref:FkbM family methyltransferase n=1 Tax=Ferruginibacter sp. TaxID=1940288 RepID=UPI00265B3284|nr:FkbM family methyltransferase [Ferruginibacter sp.]